MTSLTLQKRWLVAPAAPPEFIRRYRGMSPTLAQVLYNRGFTDPEAAYQFIYTKDCSHNPFALTDMQKVVERIRRAIRTKEHIVVYGDFDADGVTSTTLMVQALRAFGAQVTPYIPHRADEGYGLNSPALVKLAKDGVKLVITVDCGIRSVQEVEDGKAAGLDIIITDHHSLGAELPNAYAVVNPKREGYPEEMLAGVGVAFKVAQALLLAFSANTGRSKAPPLKIDSLLDLVAIGTVADLMPLNRPENRSLVRRGLEALNRAERPGVRALLEVCGIKPGGVSAMSIGFGIGPRINAAGRLEDAMQAYKLLAASSERDAKEWAERLNTLNTRRQEITRAAQDKIREKLGDVSMGSLIFASDSSFEPGIVGLVAGRLTEEYYLPAVIMEEGETESRASCRSIPQFDITQALDQCADLLVRHGGHTLAAGFTVLNENIPALKDRLMGIAQDALRGQTLSPGIEIDARLDIHQVSEDLINELEALEPTGNGNTRPTFIVERARILETRTVGKDERHLKLKIARAGQPPLDAIGFGLGDWASQDVDCLDLAFQMEINEWNGRQNLQLKLQDVRRAL
ncbi:MAG TPA: single-stranded-DNA-specific exonuclease RecJ [Phototrophicaceae bacterium]|nr:single-stranded-DNA-specific exonuclease RecJ [Phototrophicaceae bacterium]